MLLGSLESHFKFVLQHILSSFYDTFLLILECERADLVNWAIYIIIFIFYYKVSVQVQKKVGFFWVDVPCVDKVGSCDYEDICLDIPFPPGQPCPEPFLTLGLPCNCPVPQVCLAEYFCSK